MKSNLYWLGIVTLLSIAIWLGFGPNSQTLLDTYLPTIISPNTLFVPLIISLLFGLALTVFPFSSKRFRCIVYFGLLFLSFRYLFWRITSTLILDTPLSSFLSIALMVIELAMFLPNIISDFLMFVMPTDLRADADQYSKAVVSRQFMPSVDIFIATYNESEEMVERTIIGCQALDYDKKKVYVLDDGHRDSMRQLCEKLGCYYFSRPDNKHYKAGNLNYAYQRTSGDLIAFFDADFVPAKNFLTQTVGFFQNPKNALVQTPQHFYNADPIQGNLGIHESMTNEQDLFFRIIQPGRDAANSIICCGTSFIARRKNIDEIGGIPTCSITEDYVTSLALQMRGYRVLYLNKILSSGDAPATISFFVNQRLRWCSGIIQLLFNKNYNIFITKNLNLIQHYFHYITLLNWFRPVMRLALFTLPLTYFLFGFMPLRASIDELIYYFFPIYFMNCVVHNWIYTGKSSPFWTDVYDALLIVPMTMNWISTFKNPFGKGFTVTPKPLGAQKFSFETFVGLPLIILLALFGIGLIGQWFTWSKQTDHSTALINIVWSIYNCIVLWVALLSCFNVPKARYYIRKNFNKPGYITISGQAIPVAIETLCEKYAYISFPNSIQNLPSKGVVSFSFPDGSLIDASIEQFNVISDSALDKKMYQIVFGNLTLFQYRKLIEAVYCEPDHWSEKQIPEHRYSWNFLKSVCRWYPLTQTQDKAAILT